MRRLTQIVTMLLLCGGVAQQARAFSLAGPATTWMTQRLGYDINPQVWPTGQGWGGGGAMNIGEEYRFNFPNVSYGFSPAFLNYFGQRGVIEIEKAIAILNALPSADAMNIDNFPLSSQRVNHRAQAIQLYDLKSVALSALVSEMGLADPTRYVFTLRNRWTTPASTNYYVIKRNFDPDTWTYSSYINGQLWTYSQVADVLDGSESFVFTEPVDPLALGGLINAPVASGVNGNNYLISGGFWTGLTRDDVGGLRYIYRHNNYNVETVTNVFGAGLGAAVSSGGSPWTVPIYSTNTAAGGGGIVGASSNFVATSLRPGIGKVTFTRVGLESTLGQFVSNNVTYTDSYITNGVERQQTLIRSQQVPDILFDAADLQGGDANQPFIFASYGSQTWINPGGTNAGPGTIPPSVGTAPSFSLTFNTVGPTIWNGIIGGTFFVSEVSSLGQFFLWGSYDGSSDDPLIYPDKTSIQMIEQLVLGGGGGGGGGGSGGNASLVDTWTPATIILLPPGSLTTTTGGTTGGGGTGSTP